MTLLRATPAPQMNILTQADLLSLPTGSHKSESAPPSSPSHDHQTPPPNSPSCFVNQAAFSSDHRRPPPDFDSTPRGFSSKSPPRRDQLTVVAVLIVGIKLAVRFCKEKARFSPLVEFRIFSHLALDLLATYSLTPTLLIVQECPRELTPELSIVQFNPSEYFQIAVLFPEFSSSFVSSRMSLISNE
ncbi:hypothetical protein F2Q69_00050789 [Brassica cretica]|uniref:Uncharacterized protein n=1 Tax=Brassica cretica TaxID=69181 RepID=A0A8S9PST3_BRACR|nr:hypothetical protein F2Q69_00050789 [Brassica cretica]